MIDFLTYVYYRSVKFYKSSLQGATPLQIFLGFNLATILLILYRISVGLGLLDSIGDLVVIGIVLWGICQIITFPLVLIWASLQKEAINLKIEIFSKETTEEK